MDTSMPYQTAATGPSRGPNTPDSNVSVTAFGRSGTGQVAGTLTRSDAVGLRRLMSEPAMWLAIAIAAVLVLSVVRSFLGNGRLASSVLIAGAGALFAVVLVGLDHLWGTRRIRSIEDEFSCTQILRGRLVGAGELKSAATRGPGQPFLSLYATNDGVIAITEKTGNDRGVFDVEVLHLEAAPSGRYTSCRFCVDDVEYELRSVRGCVAQDPGRYQ